MKVLRPWEPLFSVERRRVGPILPVPPSLFAERLCWLFFFLFFSQTPEIPYLSLDKRLLSIGTIIFNFPDADPFYRGVFKQQGENGWLRCTWWISFHPPHGGQPPEVCPTLPPYLPASGLPESRSTAAPGLAFFRTSPGISLRTQRTLLCCCKAIVAPYSRGSSRVVGALRSDSSTPRRGNNG